MEDRLLGLHHITAIAGSARRNHDFYTKALGMRMVKKTVNFDDPHTYHFYYGNEHGEPGTILTFFPWEGVGPGTVGAGMATEIGYSVPAGSLPFWTERLKQFSPSVEEAAESFGEQYFSFKDPDGLIIRLVVSQAGDNRLPWVTEEVKESSAIRGFHSVSLMVRSVAPTAAILTDIFGYRLLKQEGNRHRFITDAVQGAAIVDIIEAPTALQGRTRAGTNHHVAFRVRNDETLMQFREKVVAKGFSITEKIDRNYFYSLYFREPGGVLFELATDNPGFEIDEPLNELGTHLKLPAQYEKDRPAIEKSLPSLA